MKQFVPLQSDTKSCAGFPIFDGPSPVVIFCFGVAPAPANQTLPLVVFEVHRLIVGSETFVSPILSDLHTECWKKKAVYMIA